MSYKDKPIHVPGGTDLGCLTREERDEYYRDYPDAAPKIKEIPDPIPWWEWVIMFPVAVGIVLLLATLATAMYSSI